VAAQCEWRFGESDEDAKVWAANPTHLHVYVDVRTPETPPGCWHRVWAVTDSWVRIHVTAGTLTPALLVVAEGELHVMSSQIDSLVQLAASLIARTGTLLEADYAPPDI
jgi:hypothetical protein